MKLRVGIFPWISVAIFVYIQMYHLKFDLHFSQSKIPAESQFSRMADMSVEEMTTKANHVTNEVHLFDSTKMYKKMRWILLFFY